MLVNSRANGFLNMVETMKKRTRLLIKDYPTFPSLVISADRLTPIGDFARAQSEFLEPDREAAKALAEQLRTKKVGVVAHFYMDPEVRMCDDPFICVSTAACSAEPENCS